VLVSPTAAALEGSLSDEQLQQLQQIAATAAASISAKSSGSNAGSRMADAAMTAVLAAVGVAVKQLQRCSLLSDVLPTLEVQPLEALTARGGMQPGVLLDWDVGSVTQHREAWCCGRCRKAPAVVMPHSAAELRAKACCQHVCKDAV
jgi:hypothetical protein